MAGKGRLLSIALLLLTAGSAAAAQDPAASRSAVAAAAYAEGVQKYQANDNAGALAAFERAAAIDPHDAEAWFNVGVLRTRLDRSKDAVEAFRKVVAVTPSRLPDDYWANAIAGLQVLGMRFNGADDPAAAAAAFRVVLAADPKSRDALFGLALSHYKQGAGPEMAAAATRLLALDPLNENGHMMLFEGLKAEHAALPPAAAGTAEATAKLDKALGATKAMAQLPFYVDVTEVGNGGHGFFVRGTVRGNAAPAGARRTLHFTLFGRAGIVGSGSVAVSAPPRGDSTNFELAVKLKGPVTSWAYRYD